jgi:hypothetical protein
MSCPWNDYLQYLAESAEEQYEYEQSIDLCDICHNGKVYQYCVIQDKNFCQPCADRGEA